jgi:DNA-binding transcriptional MerR regulator
MTADNDKTQLIYGSTDMCNLLGIKDSTLRKYCLVLQNAGYNFHTNERGQRGFFDQDVIVLRRFIDTKKMSNMTLEQAAEAVVSWVKQSDMAVSVIREKEDNERHNEDIQALKEMIEKQNELLIALANRLDQQQKYIDERLNKRDAMLMESLREVQETKKLIAATEEVKKKSFWSKLFSK